MSTSLVYRAPWSYEFVMLALYGRHYRDRLRAVAEHVPVGSTVLECCCGPGTLYLRHLRARGCRYIGLDVNPGFVARLRERGVDAREIDLARDRDPLPQADVVLIQASLYHFLPQPELLVDRMLAAATDRVLIAEPIRNLADSRLPIIGRLARRAADPGVGGQARRFDERTLDAFFDRYRSRIRDVFTIPGGREKVYILNAGRARAG